MRLLLAADHIEMQKFIEMDNRIESTEVINRLQELYTTLQHTRADVLVLSRYLAGCEKHKEVIHHIRETRPDIRIIYLYGREDKDMSSFLDYLLSMNIIDYHIGSNITSLELNRLLFHDVEKSKGYISHLLKSSPKTRLVRELDTAVITIYSNAASGKSHFSWNLATAVEKRGYRTTLINLDRGYSANIYFGIEDIYDDLLDYFAEQGEYQEVLDNCFRRGSLRVITGKLGKKESLCKENFLKLLLFARANSDIVIIDTYTGPSETTIQAIHHSTIDFLIFDCDLMHFHFNKQMLDQFGSMFIESKTFAIINNCNTGSESYKDIYKRIKGMRMKFKDVLPLSSCGSLGCDLMSTGKAPYEVVKSNSSYYLDMLNILSGIKINSNRSWIKGIFRRGE